VAGHLTYPEAIVIGLLQGVTELFPVSSLGHSILIPAMLGGSWARDLDVSAAESPYLAFIVGLHVATAAALLLFFWRDWVRILAGFWSSLRNRRVTTANERLAWLIIIGTIPVGLAGLAVEHLFRTVLGKPSPAAIFLALNGIVLYAGERLRRRDTERRAQAASTAGPTVVHRQGRSTVFASSTADGFQHHDPDSDPAGSDERIAKRSWVDGLIIGAAQILALLPGISRSGSAMVAGLLRGLSHEDAARFSFLLATPVILAAGVLKIPELFGPLGAGIHGQVLVGSIASFVGAYVAVRFLTKYFETRTLTPFAIYCFLAGFVSLIVVNL
jgi:undecaprenyl-diphosphatase